MKFDVRANQLGDRPIQLYVGGPTPHEVLNIAHSHDSASLSAQLTPEEAFRLALDLLRKAAQVGVTVREK